jgi:DtxR family transcriptional regulator, Mn-dependent transcriptional regulator
MVHTETVEDYLKAIFELVTRTGEATTSALADRLDVAAPTVSAMLKRLAADTLIARRPDHRVELTPHGEQHAVAIVRRHRLIEEFLVRTLAVPWEDVHAEAEVLEHAVSDRVLERIDAFLGRPTHDPHGDPIPAAHGPHVERWAMPLSQAPGGTAFHVERVRDRNREALRYLGQLGVRPGVVLDAVEPAPFGGPVWVTVGGRRHALGSELADLVFGVPA